MMLVMLVMMTTTLRHLFIFHYNGIGIGKDLVFCPDRINAKGDLFIRQFNDVDKGTLPVGSPFVLLLEYQ